MNSFHTKKALPTLPQPWRPHKDREWAQQSVACALTEEAHFRAFTWGEGEWLSQHLPSVSPTSGWLLQGEHAIKQSLLILQYLRRGRYPPKAQKVCNFTTAKYLANLGGWHLLGCSWIHCLAFMCLKMRLGFVAAHKPDPCWTLLDPPGSKVKGISDSDLLSTHKIKCSFHQGRQSAGTVWEKWQRNR